MKRVNYGAFLELGSKSHHRFQFLDTAARPFYKICWQRGVLDNASINHSNMILSG